MKGQDPLVELRDDVLDFVKERANADPMGAASVLFAAGFTLLSTIVGQRNAVGAMRKIVNDAARRMHN